jgi:DnaJ-class molecular chaperone
MRQNGCRIGIGLTTCSKGFRVLHERLVSLRATDQRINAMKKPAAKPTEYKCPACNGTGFPAVAQPVRPGRKIYPVRCKKCAGKGRITKAAN